jgi:hypothetical protein
VRKDAMAWLPGDPDVAFAFFAFSFLHQYDGDMANGRL